VGAVVAAVVAPVVIAATLVAVGVVSYYKKASCFADKMGTQEVSTAVEV